MCDIAINCEGGFEQVFEFSYLVMVLLFLSIGLTVSESAKLCNYMHFREPVVMNQKPLLQRANLDKAIDFMDSLEEDIPRGIYFCSHSHAQMHGESCLYGIFDTFWNMPC